VRNFREKVYRDFRHLGRIHQRSYIEGILQSILHVFSRNQKEISLYFIRDCFFMERGSFVKDHDDSTQEGTDSSPWYRDGLRFKCTGCGKCCTGSPGYVWVTVEEMSSMAKLLGISTDDFTKKYVRQRFNRYALVEMKLRNYDCIFLRDSKCLVYQARPKQCRTFPWWKESLFSKESWEIAAKSCEGINDQAPLVPYDMIQKALLENSEDA
jgi:Fe-S-cluster containining protein